MKKVASGIGLALALCSFPSAAQEASSIPISDRQFCVALKLPDGHTVTGRVLEGQMFKSSSTEFGSFGFTPTLTPTGAAQVAVYEITLHSPGNEMLRRTETLELNLAAPEPGRTLQGWEFSLCGVNAGDVGDPSKAGARCCVTCGSTTSCGCAVADTCGSCCSGPCCAK
jgi:hypothetical protein